MVEHGTRHDGSYSEVEDRGNFHDVLVEDEAYCKRISTVAFTTMDEKQVFEILEFSNGVIRGFDSLLTFQTTNANTDMCCIYHVDIVGTVTDCKSGLLRMPVLDHEYDLCFLLRADSTREDDVGAFTEIDKS